MFVLSGSFGALATILFAIPGAPLAQPRIVLSAHAFAIAVSVRACAYCISSRVGTAPQSSDLLQNIAQSRGDESGTATAILYMVYT